MNILYCGDQGIKDGVLVSILSLLQHSSEPLHIYLMTINYQDTKPFPAKAAKFLNHLVQLDDPLSSIDPKIPAKITHPDNFVHLIDATDIFVKNLPAKNMDTYFTPCSMLRLYASQVPELARLDRLLYLDYDVVCRRDLSDFYHLDLTGIEAAGVLDIYGRHFYHYHGLRQDYMNSGVMLFNMPECIKHQMFEKAIELCTTRWMLLADQSALNKAIQHRKLLPRRYNEQAERPRPDTVLHHFSNNFKFWPYFHVQKVKPFEVDKIHSILKITEYDDLLSSYQKLRSKL